MSIIITVNLFFPAQAALVHTNIFYLHNPNLYVRIPFIFLYFFDIFIL